MRPRSLLVVAACAIGLCACGSSTSTVPPTTSSTTTSGTNPVHYTYGALPSTSARMICRDETVEDIAQVLGVDTVSDPTATWVHHRYTCPYRYTDGTMVLSVKELPTLAATLAYMQVLRTTLGDTGPLTGVGQQSFGTTNGSAVTRKDNKVLVVEVSRLPAQFGKPPTTRAEVAITVTDVILTCWRGD